MRQILSSLNILSPATIYAGTRGIYFRRKEYIVARMNFITLHCRRQYAPMCASFIVCVYSNVDGPSRYPSYVIITINSIINLSHPWPSVYEEENIFIILACPAQQLLPRGHEILLDHSMVSISIYLICLIHTPLYATRGEEKLHFH